MIAPPTDAQAITAAALTTLSGLGMWYGNQTFTDAQWDAACKQAHAWGMSIVHPKLADGTHLWYDGPGLAMIKHTSEQYGLRVVPYHFCYGNAAGSSLEKEAAIDALLGNIYGGVSPDMEDQWFGHPQWATAFGSAVRAHYGGPIFPTVYANCAVHVPMPYVEVAAWATGFLPQCYFSVWTSTQRKGAQMTATEAVSYLAPQWGQLASSMMNTHGVPLVLFPIIALGNTLPPQEVGAWLTQMGGYHYCGFWHEGEYASYATTVMAHLLGKEASFPTTTGTAGLLLPSPHLLLSPSSPQHGTSGGGEAPFSSSAFDEPEQPIDQTRGAAPPLQEESTVAVGGNHQEGEDNDGSIDRDLAPGGVPLAPHLEESEVRALWRLRVSQMPWNPDSKLQALWTAILLGHPEIGTGSPIEEEQSGTVDGELVTWITCEHGRRLVYFPRTGSVCLF